MSPTHWETRGAAQAVPAADLSPRSINTFDPAGTTAQGGGYVTGAIAGQKSWTALL